MRKLLFLLLLPLIVNVLGIQPANAAGLLDSVTLPQNVYEEMVDAGLGKWITIEAKEGNGVTIGKPVICESCGSPFFSKPLTPNNNCNSCAYPVTKTTKRFFTPKKVNASGNLEIFVPEAMPDPKTPASAALKSVYREIAKLIPELEPCSCGRLNNPILNKSCYGCGLPVDQTKVAVPAKETAVVTVKGDEQMPKPVKKGSLRGTVSAEGSPATRASSLIVEERAPRFTPRFVKTAAVGGAVTAAVTLAAFGIGYVMTGNDVFVSRGEVNFISADEVRIVIPGFPKPLILKYDPSAEFNSPKYSKTTLEVYRNVDLVDVWWTRDQGVIQILPIDIFQSSDSNASGAQND